MSPELIAWQATLTLTLTLISPQLRPVLIYNYAGEAGRECPETHLRADNAHVRANGVPVLLLHLIAHYWRQ